MNCKSLRDLRHSDGPGGPGGALLNLCPPNLLKTGTFRTQRENFTLGNFEEIFVRTSSYQYVQHE